MGNPSMDFGDFLGIHLSVWLHLHVAATTVGLDFQVILFGFPLLQSPIVLGLVHLIGLSKPLNELLLRRRCACLGRIHSLDEPMGRNIHTPSISAPFWEASSLSQLSSDWGVGTQSCARTECTSLPPDIAR